MIVRVTVRVRVSSVSTVFERTNSSLYPLFLALRRRLFLLHALYVIEQRDATAIGKHTKLTDKQQQEHKSLRIDSEFLLDHEDVLPRLAKQLVAGPVFSLTVDRAIQRLQTCARE